MYRLEAVQDLLDGELMRADGCSCRFGGEAPQPPTAEE